MSPFFKRLSIVIGILIVVIAAAIAVSYANRPRISYSFRTADCGSQAVAARNGTLGVSSKACVLVVSAHNTQNRSVYVDYDGVGGGPPGGREPLIRIYSGDTKFCYALLASEAASFAPRATNTLTLRCASLEKPPKNYDQSSDTKPTSIVIDGSPKTALPIK